jgi:hypothetical protein
MSAIKLLADQRDMLGCDAAAATDVREVVPFDPPFHELLPVDLGAEIAAQRAGGSVPRNIHIVKCWATCAPIPTFSYLRMGCACAAPASDQPAGTGVRRLA